MQIKNSEAKKVLEDIKSQTHKGQFKLNKGGYVHNAIERVFPSKNKSYAIDYDLCRFESSYLQ